MAIPVYSAYQEPMIYVIVITRLGLGGPAVSDLQSPIPRARSARDGGDCKSDTAQLGVL